MRFRQKLGEIVSYNMEQYTYHTNTTIQHVFGVGKEAEKCVLTTKGPFQ